MGAQFIGQKTFTVGVSGTYRTVFNTEGASCASFQLVRYSGSQDASYRIFTTNFGPENFSGMPGSNGSRSSMTGSAYRKFWYAEPGASGSAFTGSASIPADPFMMHFVDIGSRAVMVEVSSSSGGRFELVAHGKQFS